MLAQSVKLFEFIEMTYGIAEANENFLEYFVNALKKNYKHLSFEQIQDAFERNSFGLLDNFLPKVGQRPDNKVLKFNIPDLTKIINAYCRYTGVEKSEQDQGRKVFSTEEKSKIRQEWCDQLCAIFEKYAQAHEMSVIRTPLYTCNMLARLSVLDANRIDFSEPSTNIMATKSRSNNEKLIYECFQTIINDGMHINDFLFDFRNEFN